MTDVTTLPCPLPAPHWPLIDAVADDLGLRPEPPRLRVVRP